MKKEKVKRKLSDVVFAIINDHSGGIKFIELLTEVLQTHMMEGPIEELMMLNEKHLSELLMNKISELEEKGVGVTVYTFKPFDRTKYFVYTK